MTPDNSVDCCDLEVAEVLEREVTASTLLNGRPLLPKAVVDSAAVSDGSAGSGPPP